MPHKLRALVLLAAGLALLFVLATSLPGPALWPGTPFAIPPLSLPMSQDGAGPGDNSFVTVVRIILALSLLALPVVLIYSLLKPDRRKRLLIYLASLAAMYWLITNVVPRNSALQLDSLLRSARQPASATAGTAPSLPIFSANPSDTVVWLATIVVVLLIVAGAAGMMRLMAQRQRPSPLQELAGDAQAALDAIQAGGPLEETILRCYRDMCAVLQSERNMQRGASMTPSEFVQMLQGKGLPISPFQQLTRLFEDLRYGGGRPGLREEQQAIDSLTAIVAACSAGRGVGRGAK